MRYALSATRQFHSSHAIPGHALCSRTHGHTYVVMATASHDGLSEAYPRGSSGLPEALGEVASELNLRDLREMLPGLETTTVGLAAWFFERLSVAFPGLESVSVSNEMEAGEARR